MPESSSNTEKGNTKSADVDDCHVRSGVVVISMIGGFRSWRMSGRLFGAKSRHTFPHGAAPVQKLLPYQR
jgi:hypothetical protein